MPISSGTPSISILHFSRVKWKQNNTAAQSILIFLKQKYFASISDIANWRKKNYPSEQFMIKNNNNKTYIKTNQCTLPFIIYGKYYIMLIINKSINWVNFSHSHKIW